MDSRAQEVPPYNYKPQRLRKRPRQRYEYYTDLFSIGIEPQCSEFMVSVLISGKAHWLMIILFVSIRQSCYWCWIPKCELDFRFITVNIRWLEMKEVML